MQVCVDRIVNNVTDNNNYIANTWGNTDEACLNQESYGRSQCNENAITVVDLRNSNNIKTYRYQGIFNIRDHNNQVDTNHTIDKTMQSSTADKHQGVVRKEKTSYFNMFVKGVFVLKYNTNKDEARAFLRNVNCLINADIDKLLKGERKPNCTRCQYYCFLTCLTLTGAMMPPTPSPYLLPNSNNTMWQKQKNPMYPTKLTEQQYYDLYGDFQIANDVKNYRNKRDTVIPDRIDELSVLVEREMRKIIHTFTGEVFTSLLDEYLKLFEEMVKGLILLKETGITLEDICSIGEESHAHCCQQASWHTDADIKVSFSQPYNATEFEELLLEQVKQFRHKEDAKCGYKSQGINQSPVGSRGHQICDCKLGVKENPYFDFLSHIKPSNSTEEFDQIICTEKQLFLKSCLELLRDNDYFRIHSQSSAESVPNALNSDKDKDTHDIIEEEMYKMSVNVYNKTVSHVQSSIFAIFLSMKQRPGRNRLLPPTPKTTQSDRNIEAIDCTFQIKNALSDYLKESDQSASSDEVFIHKDKVQNNPNLQQSYTYGPEQDSQSIPLLRYENEIKHNNHGGEEIQYEPSKRRHLPNQEVYPSRREEIMQQHPDLEYAASSCHTNMELGQYGVTDSQERKNGNNLQYIPQNAAQTHLTFQNRQGTTASVIQEQGQNIGNRTVIIPPSQREIDACFFNKPLFKKKRKDASVVCVLNYHNPEISHIDAIAFLKRMEMEEGVLHYPYCNENTFLTKMESPSFYLSVCCSLCHQQLAPPQKLEAFKSENKKLQRSKLVSHIIGKNRDPFYFPVKCGSCSHFLCEPERGKKMFVPFHSATKGFICASRLKSHRCEYNLSEKDYTGCPSDTINISSQATQKKNEDTMHPHDFNTISSHKRMGRSRSLPILCSKDFDFRDAIKNEKEACMNKSLKFEEAVSNILNMWTYEMIDYEKGANTPHLRSQILNYRKSLSIFIKKDIREKLYYRHILSVFKRVEEYESPILDFQKHLSTQRNTLDCKALRKSHSCHSKLSYEASLATRRSKYESPAYKGNSAPLKHSQQLPDSKQGVQQSSYLRPGTRNNMTRPLSLHSELKQKSPAAQRRRSCSFTETAYKEDFSIQMNAWKNELQELQKSIESPDLRFETVNRQNIVRPVSLHSELKQKSVTIPHRRRSSCSFATESRHEDYSTQITVWRNELLKLQKSVESPYLKTDTMNRHNITRPLSLHSEINQKPTTQRRRSCSFTEYKDSTTNINAWKKELHELQKSVESPNMRFGAVNRTYAKENSLRPERTSATQRPKSESFINQFSAQINKSKVELLRLQKSFETLRMRAESVHPNAPIRQSEPIMNNQYSTELNAWKNELLNLQKSAESPYLNSRNRKVNIRGGSLDSEPKRITSAAPPLKAVLEDSITELKTWNHKLRELERDASSPHWETGKLNRRIKTRALSLHTEPKRTTNLHRNRPKSESVLDDFSTELDTWKHELLTLEEDARNPQPESQKRKNMAKSRSLNSDPKVIAHKVNFDAIDNGDPSGSTMTTQGKRIETNISLPSSQKSPIRRYSSTPRQLPAIPDHKSRRHSHYETTGSFVNLLSNRRATRLNTHVHNPTLKSSSYDCADPSLDRQDKTSNHGFLRPDESATRGRFFSQ